MRFQPTPAVSGHRLRVLLVDDEPTQLEVWCTLLAHVGYEVYRADQGLQALLHLPAIDCVITDYNMPHVNGVELIRVCAGRRGPRFILLSGSASREIGEAALAAGAVSVLEKPIPPERLVREIEQACAHVPHAAPAPLPQRACAQLG